MKEPTSAPVRKFDIIFRDDDTFSVQMFERVVDHDIRRWEFITSFHGYLSIEQAIGRGRDWMAAMGGLK